jgi:allantoinase
MKIAKKLGLPVAVHAESEEITSRLGAEIRAKGRKGWKDYLASRPIVAEVEATVRAITLAGETGCQVHIVHVTNSRCSELVQRAHDFAGADVTCETCPHYLAMCDEDLQRMGALAKCAPPLRSSGDVDEMWQDLAEGKFAFVASDHSPAPSSMKTSDDAFAIWGGIAGVQSTLPILLSHSPRLPIQQIAALTSANVADRFAIARKGKIAVGFDADIALVDIAACFTLEKSMLHDRNKANPYVGRSFNGIVRRTIAGGQTIFADGKIIPGRKGRLIRRSGHA